MPERPKRRKNKNKRKNNKNSTTDVNKNNIEESETLNESCSNVTETISKENAEQVEQENLEITAPSETNNIFNESIKCDVTQVAEQINDKNEVISSKSPITTESYKPSLEISHELEQSEEFTKEIMATSDIFPVLQESSKINADYERKEKENNNSILSDVSALSKRPLNNVDTINEKVDDVLQAYIVETPEQVISSKTKCKLDNTKKSKSCESDDCPTIVEITDDANVQNDDSSISVINNNNVIISGDDSEIEWEKVHHFDLPQTQLIQGILSSDTIPLNIVHCDQIKSLSPQDEISLRNYLHTLNLSTSPSNTNVGDIKTEIEQIINREIKYRLRKKGLTEDTTFIRAGPSRSLAVIDEEGSGDSSKTSRRHSYLSDKKSDNEELEDDVFECKPTPLIRCGNINSIADNSNKRLIPQPCIRVDAKLKEPEISEARGDWSVKTVEKMTGVELVYLTDSSSSTSSVYDLNDDDDKGEETDVTVRMITPTIEVTDTESLLSNTFLSNNNDVNVSKTCDNVCEDVTKSTEDNTTKNFNDKETDSISKHGTHEIIVLNTENIKTNLVVKDINESRSEMESKKLCETNLKHENSLENQTTGSSNVPKNTDIYDLEIKVLKCELNNAINNLIKEVISDSDNNKDTSKDTLTRQDSSSSLDSSQCTAKYNPTHSSLNDVSNILQEDIYDNTIRENLQIDADSSHVKDVLQCVTAKPPQISKKIQHGDFKQPFKLKDICVKKITSFPFGDKILEELAHVSLRLQNMSALASEHNKAVKNQSIHTQTDTKQHELRKSSEYKTGHHNENTNIPPPILPRKSSLKIAQDEPIKFVNPKTEVKYECLSPSQKMLMEKTNTTIENDFKFQSNINESINYKENKFNHPNIQTSIAPMKSETGSRLLALLKDTSISSNLNNQILEAKDSNQIPKIKSHSETFSKRLLDEIDSTNHYTERTNSKKSFSTISSNSYKPLPPPKPKKISSYFYESDGGSDYRGSSYRTMSSNKKYFHYSTGNLSKEIEEDISSIQNMHRYSTNLRDRCYESSPRRPSLPKDLCDQQMEYIRQKEKEVDAELRRLEQEQNKSIKNRGPRAPMISDDKSNYNHKIDSQSKNSTTKAFASTSQLHKNIGNSKLSSLFSSSQEELLREKMYSEYVNQMAEREQRKQQRVIKVTQTPANSSIISKSMPLLDDLDSKMNNRIEQEFISKARERWCKLGIKDPETEDENNACRDVYREPKVIEHKIKVIEAGEEKDVKKLPSHMQEFVKFTVKDKEQETGSTAIWRPGAPSGGEAPSAPSPGAPPLPPPPPVWTPGSATTSPQTLRKTFRPVHFEDTPPPRRKFGSSDQNGCTSGSESEGRLRTSQSAPATGLNSLGSSSSRLPRAQNPTVTLLQKAREGQIPRAPSIPSPREENHRLARDRPSPPRGESVHASRKDYASESEAERSDFERSSHRMTDAKKKIEGIGPTTKDGMPVTLRSEVKDPSKWYKKMYDTIHKNKYDEDYVTIRYKNRRGETLQRPSSNRSQYAYFDPRSGYLSEPEGGLSRLASSTWSDAYDSDVTSGPRRRTASVQEDRRLDEVPAYIPNNKYSTLASARARQEVYKTQPGRIENYIPGKSSVIDKEAKQWWDEVMDIFDGQNESNALSQSQASPKEKKDITSAILSKSNMARALKESGYESDSTLIFRRREDTEAPLSPAERRAAYRDLQAGGEPPLRGFRSPAPPRQDESEIEYIPISSTLTKIRVHKKTPQTHEVICYPVTSIFHDYEDEECPKYRSRMTEYPPIPPRRISSKNSRTLQLVTSTRPTTSSPKRFTFEKSNVEYLKNKISYKLNRENTHIIIKKNPSPKRIISTSAPPALNRHKMINTTVNTKQKTTSGKNIGTSSFSTPRRTILPINYPNTGRKQGEISSVVLEGGAGRKTPITNILDKITPLDKLWSSQKRNERIDISKIKPKSMVKHGEASTRSTLLKTTNSKPLVPVATHKSRDMIRTSEKVQRMKISNLQAKSTPCLTKSDSTIKPTKSNSLQVMSNMSKSSSQIAPISRKSTNQVKTASITNLKKKKSLETILIRPRSVPCHELPGKKIKELNKNIKKSQKSKHTHKKVQKDMPKDSQKCNQFGEIFKKINSKDIEKAHDAVVSDSFFQHLFLGKQLSSALNFTHPEQDSISSVLQKAKMFQSLPESNLSYPNSLNTYLIHRKPVSLSRFKMWDRQSTPLHVQNPRSVSWPGKMDGKIRKFDSLLKFHSEFGSTSSLATVRSRSEPPTNKLYFSQTSRPVSPSVIFHKKPESSTVKFISPNKFVYLQNASKDLRSSDTEKRGNLKHKVSPTRIIFSELVRSISPSEISEIYDLTHKGITDKNQGTIFFSQTSRPISPNIINKTSGSRSHSTSPASIRSPSYRRIHNARTQTKLETLKKEFRTRSVDNVEKHKKIKIPSRAKSDSNIYENDPDYDEYVRDLKNLKGRSERFRELNRYYTYLERVAELEKATSSKNLCYRKKDEEIIDFDRWKKIRTIERAEEELNNLYSKLKKAQNENDILFYPRDVNDFRWDYNRERGLRVKEKSVEDLKEELQQKSHEDTEIDRCQCKDTYKPLWRGTSVAETALTINKRNEIKGNKFFKPDKPKTCPQVESLTDLRKKIGLGHGLWSSLSMEQVNALKNQLNAIYSKEFDSKSNKENENYTIDVEDATTNKSPMLHVRCSSLISPRSKDLEPELNKSKSIAAISYPVASEKELKNNVNKMQMSLTENEKKRISQSLSKEVLNRINKFDTAALKQEIDNTVNTNDSIKEQKKEEENTDLSIQTYSEINAIRALDEKNRHVIYPAQNLEISNQSSASETETGSSDISGKTVIYNEPKKEVRKKVEYFESVKNEINQPKNIYHARDSSDEHRVNQKPIETKDDNVQNNQIFQSQSCTNIKEFFGESERNKFLSLPSKSDLNSRSPSPRSEVNMGDRRTPDTLRFSSDETIWRSRSPSPDPERYWRTYLKLAREGEVRRLARRFDSPSAAGAVLRRYRSDPEIIRNDIKNIWPFSERATRRGKCRALLPVARMPLRPSNRFMPHIDVISKLAALRKRNTTRSHSAEEALECRPGEVERIRRRFEAMSLLGQIYTSAPDVRYLDDIESYLAGPWIAHRYPKPEDNYRSIGDTTTLVRGRTTDKRENIKTAKRESVKLNSILKNESLAKQAFNPLAHRPASRYEPPRTPPRPPPASWPHRLAPYITPSRHTVTFQESDTAPVPPRRASRGSYSDTESPSRRYVESDVNIHYRCPVRHDPLPLVPERELAIQQAEHMKRLYREQRRNKYLQELQDMQNRRHQDNFMPSQKSVVPLNRYDEAEKIVAKALYTFNGQTARELSFRKGDIINVRRQIDSNWYEGEVRGKVGLFPYNYVELLKGDVVQTLKKPAVIEGRARAKFDFIAQTNLELPLKKGEIVVLSRRIDHNWWEGRNANRTGIFPDSYVTILQEPSQSKPEPILTTTKPVASPVAHGLLNGTDKRSMGSHSYTPQPNSPALSNAPPATQPLSGYVTKSSQGASASERGYGPPTGAGVDLNNTEPLYVDTNAEAVPYRAMYKYRPQNPDELELQEGDTVYVLEKCDDGWYVGSSQRTGRFGTFPGNYVERI